MIHNKSQLRKKIKESNALKKDIHSTPFGVSKYQMEKMESLYAKHREAINNSKTNKKI